MKVIVYADFNCVYCYLASQQADRLMREGTAEVEWRAVEHLPRLPVTGYKPQSGELPPGDAGGEDDLAEAACLALPDEWLPASLPAVISNTRAAVSAYAEAITDGVQDQLRLRLFEAIWAQGRNMSSALEVQRVIADLLWPADPVYLHLISPDLPTPVLHDPDPMRIVRREGGTVTQDGGPLTTVAYDRVRQWRQEWLALSRSARSRSARSQSALPEPAVPAVIGPDGAVHAGPDGLRCLAAIVVRTPLAGVPLPGSDDLRSRERLLAGRGMWPAARAGDGVTMKPTQALHEAGQSLWPDNITRALLDGGILARYVAEYSVTGLTSQLVRTA